MAARLSGARCDRVRASSAAGAVHPGFRGAPTTPDEVIMRRPHPFVMVAIFWALGILVFPTVADAQANGKARIRQSNSRRPADRRAVGASASGTVTGVTA